jgi:hypothetical protein
MSKRPKPLKGRQLGDLLASQVPRRQAPRPHSRVKRNEMSKLEIKYQQHLNELIRAGVVASFEYERNTINLAKRTTYTPDWLIQYTDGRVVYHETKGYMEEDAWIRMKIANRMQMIPIYVVTWNRAEGWVIKPVDEADRVESDAA